MADISRNGRQQHAETPQTQFHFSKSSILKLMFSVLSAILLFGAFNNNLNVPSIAGGSSYFRLWSHEQTHTSHTQPDGQQAGVSSPSRDCRLPTARYDIHTDQAACYPSSGGIWMVELDPLELRYLGINRFASTERSINPADEDRFCHELRQFGGSWFNPRSADDLWSRGEEKCDDISERVPVFEIHRQIGFPGKGGGVWVLEPTVEEDPEGNFFPIVRYPRGMATVHNAMTMDERCTALKAVGAVFCDKANLADCPGLQDLAKEPFELEEEYGWRDTGFCGTF